MVNGRCYTLEDQIDETRQELARLRRELSFRERDAARIVNEPEWERALRRMRDRELALTLELARLEEEAAAA